MGWGYSGGPFSFFYVTTKKQEKQDTRHFLPSCSFSSLPYTFTRGPWTAMPALIKVEETRQINNLFTCKKHSKLLRFYGNMHSVWAQFRIFGPKSAFSSSALNPFSYRNWLEVQPILCWRYPAFRPARCCQIWMVGVGVTCDQPKGVKLGIFC